MTNKEVDEVILRIIRDFEETNCFQVGAQLRAEGIEVEDLEGRINWLEKVGEIEFSGLDPRGRNCFTIKR